MGTAPNLTILLGLVATYKDDPEASGEALRCIANAMLLIERARSVFISKEVNGGEACISLLQVRCHSLHLLDIRSPLLLHRNPPIRTKFSSSRASYSWRPSRLRRLLPPSSTRSVTATPSSMSLAVNSICFSFPFCLARRWRKRRWLTCSSSRSISSCTTPSWATARRSSGTVGVPNSIRKRPFTHPICV